MRHIAPSLLLACAIFTLSGCKDDATRADEFYQSGVELLEQGDTDRAMVELRNVFKYDGFHRDARKTYADILYDTGKRTEAYSQYLRLAEQYPDLVDVRVKLANMSLDGRDEEAFIRHSEAAIDLAPERDDVKALDLLLKYQQAVRDDDDAAREAIFKQSQALLSQIRAQSGENDGLMRLTLEHLVANGQKDQALETLDQALGLHADDPDLNLLRAQLLQETGQDEALGDQLRKLSELLPGNILVKDALISWYLSQGDRKGALAYLRDLAGEDTGPVEGHIEVIRFLGETEGLDAARAEATRLAEANSGTENGRYYEATLATWRYEQGEQEEAIADLRAIVDASETGVQKNRLRMSLVRMLNSTGHPDEADELIEATLQDDGSNVEALQAKASRLILADKPGEAILALRTALDQAPQNPDTLTLMAQAHERDGDANLAAERLASAMKASGNGLPQSLRYARFLLGQDREQAALSVLERARATYPDDAELLQLLVRLYIANEDWAQAEGIARHIRSIDTDAAQQMATEVEAYILAAQGRDEESVATLTTRYENQPALDVKERIRTGMLIIRKEIGNDNLPQARALLDEMLAQYTASSDLKLLDAGLAAQMGQTEVAEEKYRTLIADFPQAPMPVRLFAGLLDKEGRSEESRELVEQALQRMPDNLDLKRRLARYEERDGNIEAAIAIYDDIYEQTPTNRVIANNLASLIASHTDDEAELARAAQIANQLRSTELAPFQDTYGWITFRRGNAEEALGYLEPAARELASDPSVQFHLGMVYDALGKKEEAADQLGKAIELWGEAQSAEKETAAELLRSYE